MIKKKEISQKDLDTWQEYIKNPDDIFDKDSDNKNQRKKYRFTYDLHGYSLQEANKKTKEIILFCLEKKYKEILLITGKGMHTENEKEVFVSKEFSKLKYSVPNFIKTDLDLSKHISSLSNAERKDGGEGAIIIKLKFIV